MFLSVANFSRFPEPVESLLVHYTVFRPSRVTFFPVLRVEQKKLNQPAARRPPVVGGEGEVKCEGEGGGEGERY